jgi:hypothetical protein
MDNLSNHSNQKKKRNSTLNAQKYAYLKAEAKAPYKGLRKFFYLAFAASGFLGALIFLSQLIGGKNISSALPNLALQLGVIALMVWLFRWEEHE